MDALRNARVALQHGDHDLASRCYGELLSQEPDHVEALSFLASAADRNSDWGTAIDLASRVSALRPDLPMPLVIVARARRSTGDFHGAIAASRNALGIDPRCFPALLEWAESAFAVGRRGEALSHWMQALDLAESYRTHGVPRSVAASLDRAAAHVNAAMGEATDATLERLEAAYGKTAMTRIRGAADIFCGRRRREPEHPLWSPGLMFIPGLEPRPWFERHEFDWIEWLEAATDEIREELLAVMGSSAGFAPYVDDAPGKRGAEHWAALNRSLDWSAYHFSRRGIDFEENRRRCPRTSALLDRLPLMRVPGYAPEPMFSVLRPGTRIPPHHGSVNGRLTVHLPLIVPRHCGALKVGDEAREWEEGRVMVFDDAMLHEAWNDSDQARAVLIFDIWNPQLSVVEREGFSELLQAAQRFERGIRASS